MTKLGMPAVRMIFGLAAATACVLTAPIQAKAASPLYTLSDIAQFSGSNQLQTPFVPIKDRAKGFYVPLNNGGSPGVGGIVHITPSQKGWNAPETIYTFSSVINGTHPNTLFSDTKGILYGTTFEGGKYNAGTAFKLTPPANSKAAWLYTKLYDFKNTTTDHSDVHPFAAAMTADGKLIVQTEGVSETLGGPPTNSVLVALAPGKVGQPWTQTVIEKFTGFQLNSISLTSSGGIIGTEPYIQNKSNGSIWQWSFAKGKWASTKLYEYPAYTATDGQNPVLAEELDNTGALYGTTRSGGTGVYGTVFKLTPGKAQTSPWILTVLHSFPISGSEGQYPKSYLAMDTSGSLEGSTAQGGPGNLGTIFKLTPNGKTWGESTIYSGPKLATGAVIVGTNGENPIGITNGNSTLAGTFFMLTKPTVNAKPAVPVSNAPGSKIEDSLSLSAGPSK